MTNQEIINADFPMGENTNSNIGLGVKDWQHVGGGKQFPTPPLGPVAQMMKNPKMTDGHLYGTSEGITMPDINAKSTGGVVGKPKYGDGGIPAISKAQDVTNSTTNLNSTYNHENLSAKFKNPQVKQNLSEPERNQYM